MTRPVTRARVRGREERARFHVPNGLLLESLRAWLADQYGIELVPTDGKHFLRGSRAEIVPAEGCLYFDRKLESKPAELLEVVAHEYGHLVLHNESFGVPGGDLIRGSAFLNAGSSALSRYSPKSQQEAEASGFAAEFVCPARDIFEKWKRNVAISPQDLAAEYVATPSLVLLQLAEGLYEHLAGEVESREAEASAEPTPEQEKAATLTGFPVLLDAGPGTGKTKTLVRRVEHLVRDHRVEPEKILVLTFSNEAAGELQERIERCLGSEAAAKIVTATFHGFGVILLNLFGQHANLDVDFSIVDEVGQVELLSELVGSIECEALLDIKNPDETAAEAVRHINYLKDRLIDPAGLRAAIAAWSPSRDEADSLARAKALLRLFEEYEKVKASRQSVDLADLIQIPHRLLSSREDLREEIRTTFRWVMVDEYQDVSRATALLLQQVCGPGNPPWVVGDPRQAIYRFRGAEPENVRRFGEDFIGARSAQLAENYRSSPEIVQLLNRLAGWLNGESGASDARWKAARKIVGFGGGSSFLASANSDAAERTGIADTVRDWLAKGLKPDDIAILARRNVDVRNIAVELKKREVRAVTSGLLTAEGAGGDLAAVLGVVDAQQAIPRVAYALCRHLVPRKVLNEAISQLLSVDLESGEEPNWVGDQKIQQTATALWHICKELRRALHSGDGWSVLCDFLFFQSSYLRELLGDAERAEVAVQLEEVLSALALAANYRFSHPHVSPRRSRLGLAERMRELVTESAPGLVPPRPSVGAVRVMTCHAAKGLEFPAVLVAGQSLANIPTLKECLPPALRQNPELDSLQADSLLFVGISRAQRAVVVSFANSASGRARSRMRRFPQLLMQLRGSAILPVSEWLLDQEDERDTTMGQIWGGKIPEEVSSYSLRSDGCGIRTYLEEHLGARFRGRMRPLYPEFIQRSRKVLHRIIAQALETGRAVPANDVDRMVDEEWPPDQAKNHPHLSLYRPRLSRWAQALARAFDPCEFPNAKIADRPLEWKDRGGTVRTLKLQLVAEFGDGRGKRFAIALRVRSSDEAVGDVRWSSLKDYERLPFVLLQEQHGSLEPRVFFGEEGTIRSFRWSARKPLETNRARAQQAHGTFEGLAAGRFEGKVEDWMCDRCSCRTICPSWLSAVDPPQTPPGRK